MSNANTSGAIQRITKEIANIQQGSDLSLAVAYQDSDVRQVRALIVGPPETPYEFGFFEFDIKFGKEYPIKSPHVRAITTNGSKCRFNPNIYNCGKVCLSILGTWRGQPGEEWSSAQGLESILLSIQSLMSQNPYENEPGYESWKKDDKMPSAYISKIRHETLRIAVIQSMETILGIEHPQPSNARSGRSKSKKANHFSTASTPIEQSPSKGNSGGALTPSTEVSAYEYDAEATYNALDSSEWVPFTDLIKRRFLWYHDSYLNTIDTFSSSVKDGQAFERMEFEYPPNSMEGTYDYTSLRRRLSHIASNLDEETKSWFQAGAGQARAKTQLATQLTFQFKQLAHQWNECSHGSGARMELRLPDATNPFTWQLTLLGRPMSNLDGGIFNFTLSIPPTFPEMQPRVKVDTPIFHHRVSSRGDLYYFPEKEDELSSHLEAIVQAIEEDDPPYDPRAPVNPQAFALLWGGEEKRKIYLRKLRRSAQESSEY